jgi:hypothetical protein
VLQRVPAICRHYTEQATRLQDLRTPIGGNDLWIGCQALADAATLVTHNARKFDAAKRWLRGKKADVDDCAWSPRSVAEALEIPRPYWLDGELV